MLKMKLFGGLDLWTASIGYDFGNEERGPDVEHPHMHNNFVFRFKLKTECTMCKNGKAYSAARCECHVIKVTGYCFSVFATDGQRLFTL